MKPKAATRMFSSLGWLVSLSGVGTGVAWAEPGDHIRSGNLEIIPSVEMRAQRRSNVYLSEGESSDTDGNEVGLKEESGSAVRVHPSVVVEVKGADHQLEMNFDYNMVRFLEPEHQNLNRYKDLEFGLVSRLLSKSPVGLKFSERYHIAGRETEAVQSNSAYINHTMNQTGARISVRPGSSLELDLGGVFAYDKYDVSGDTSNTGNPTLNSRLGYGPVVDLAWTFFPRTAIIAGYEQSWFSWENNLVDTQGDGLTASEFGSSLGIPDGSLWRSSLGLRGRITEKVVLGLVAGYGQMDYDEDTVSGQGSEGNAKSQGYDRDLNGLPEGLTGLVELGYHPADSQTITFGYRKAFQDVYFTNFVDFHNVFFRYESLFAEQVGAKVTAGYRYEQYVGEVNRDDHVLNLGLDMAYHATKWMDVGGGVLWQQRGSADGSHGDVEYDDTTINLGLVFTY
jgi:hypothetical protein